MLAGMTDAPPSPAAPASPQDIAAAALAALWACHQRPGPGGVSWAAIDGCASIADFADDLVADAQAGGGGLVGAARAFLPAGEGLSAEERQALVALVELADMLTLRTGHEAVLRTLVDQVDARAAAAPPAPKIRMTAARRARRRAQRQKSI